MRTIPFANQGTAEQELRAAGDATTLVRTIIQGSAYPTATNAQIANLFVEMWRKGSNIVLPGQDIAGDINYADNKDLLWAGVFGGMRTVAGEMSSLPINLDMKGNRKLGRDDSLIMRFAGDSGIAISVMLTQFYKET